MAPQIERHIQNLAGDGAHQFSLRLQNLVMQSAHNILLGVGMIVLNKGIGNSEVRKSSLVVAFQEKSAIVAEYAGLEQQKSRKSRGKFFNEVLVSRV